jgi:MFS family permease
VLTEYLDWRWTLYVNVVIAVFVLAGVILPVPRFAPAARPRLDVPGVLLVSAGLFCIVFGFADAETHPWGNWMVWGFLAPAPLSWRPSSPGRAGRSTPCCR